MCKTFRIRSIIGIYKAAQKLFLVGTYIHIFRASQHLKHDFDRQVSLSMGSYVRTSQKVNFAQSINVTDNKRSKHFLVILKEKKYESTKSVKT